MNLSIIKGFVSITDYSFRIKCNNKICYYIYGTPFYYDEELSSRDTSIQDFDLFDLSANLTGNFLIIKHDENNKIISIVTDHGNSFHPYFYISPCKKFVFLSSRIENLYDLIPNDLKPSIDFVSIVDYMINRSITSPFTFYKNINELDFASITYLESTYEIIKVSKKSYWLPTCSANESSTDLKQLSNDLSQNIRHIINSRVANKKDIGIFLSGGIDSRVLAEIISQDHKNLNVKCFTIYDSYNYECEIAAAVCDKLGFEHIPLVRDEEYFPSLIDKTYNLEGGHCHYEWASYLGFEKEITKFDLDALLGGYMSDSLLKLHEDRVHAKRILGRHCGIIEEFDKRPIEDLRGGRNYINKFFFLFETELLNEVILRRENHLRFWENLRRDGSAYEWSFLFPFSQNKHNTNLTTNLFQFPGFEIYTDQRIIEVARYASRKIKLNGRLFNDAAYPIIQDTRDIPFPSTNIRLIKNHFLRESTIIARNLLPRKLFSQKKRNVSSKGGHWILGDGTRSYEDIWRKSKILKRHRNQYEPNLLENRIFKKSSYSIFDTSRFQDLRKESSRHIMSTIISLNALLGSK